MKWIKTAIGAVIVILSIGFISTSVFKMTQSSEVIEKEVSFETDIDEETYYPTSIYNEILEYAVIDEYRVINIVSGYIDNEEIDDIIILYFPDDSISIQSNTTIPSSPYGVHFDIYDDGCLFNGGSIYDVNIKLVFAVPQPPQLTGISAALILLMPLVFVGGVLLFFKNRLKKD